jgi:hypothetical protein
VRAANAGFVDDAGIFHVIARVAQHRNNRIEAVGVVVYSKLFIVFVGDYGRLWGENMVNLKNTIRKFRAIQVLNGQTLLSVRRSKA